MGTLTMAFAALAVLVGVAASLFWASAAYDNLVRHDRRFGWAVFCAVLALATPFATATVWRRDRSAGVAGAALARRIAAVTLTIGFVLLAGFVVASAPF